MQQNCREEMSHCTDEEDEIFAFIIIAKTRYAERRGYKPRRVQVQESQRQERGGGSLASTIYSCRRILM